MYALLFRVCLSFGSLWAFFVPPSAPARSRCVWHYSPLVILFIHKYSEFKCAWVYLLKIQKMKEEDTSGFVAFKQVASQCINSLHYKLNHFTLLLIKFRAVLCMHQHRGLRDGAGVSVRVPALAGAHASAEVDPDGHRPLQPLQRHQLSVLRQER